MPSGSIVNKKMTSGDFFRKLPSFLDLLPQPEHSFALLFPRTGGLIPRVRCHPRPRAYNRRVRLSSVTFRVCRFAPQKEMMLYESQDSAAGRGFLCACGWTLNFAGLGARQRGSG